MTDEELSNLRKLLIPKTTKYTIWTPWHDGKFNAKQNALMLMNDVFEVLFGGAVGGGKSVGALQLASQFVDIPGYSALLLRRTFPELSKAGSLMDLSFQWWKNTDAHWDGALKRWTFPSGAKVEFGYMQHAGDEHQYQSAAYQLIEFDETTQFRPEQYIYMVSRLRRPEGFPVPIRLRAFSNPGGISHEFFKTRFNLPHGPGPETPQRAFLAALLDDNPYLDTQAYESGLKELGDTTFKQLRLGNWDALTPGGRFDPSDFNVIDQSEVPPPSEFATVIRYWDLAGTAPNEEDPDPDWSVGLKIGMTKRGRTNVNAPDFYILDVTRFRQDPGETENIIKRTALRDGVGIPQWFEQERGGAGKLLIGTYDQSVLPGHMVFPLYVTGDKETRAKLPAAMAREGRIYVVNELWVPAFFDELGQFPLGGHDDQVDGLSGGVISCQRQGVMGSVGRARQY
jgi:predicted phage terminase large subunit-like protein